MDISVDPKKRNLVISLLRIFSTLIAVGFICSGGIGVIQAMVIKVYPPSAIPATLEEISSVEFSQIDHIQTNRTNNGRYAPSELKKNYYSNYYVQYSPEYPPSGTNIFYNCYDKDNALLFTLVDYNHDGLIEVTVGDDALYYQNTSAQST